MSNTFFFFVQAATLSGFRACAVMLDREMVPVLLEEENGATRGVLVAELTDEDVRRISHFEGLDYKAGRCTVGLRPGRLKIGTSMSGAPHRSRFFSSWPRAGCRFTTVVISTTPTSRRPNARGIACCNSGVIPSYRTLADARATGRWS